MKHEPTTEKKRNVSWIIDESKCLSIEEVNRLKTFGNKTRKHGMKVKRFTLVRNWFMTELGLNAGLRVQEMASLKHGDLLIEGAKSSIVVVGKGNKKRSIWINSEFKKNCRLYVECKKNFGYCTDKESPLLNSLKGDQITKRALQKFFKSILKEAGLPDHYYIHCLRHTYTTFLLKASKYNYRFVQKQLGHASIKTTQVYAGIIESDGRRAVEDLYK